MSDMEISSSTASDLTGTLTDYSVDPANTDGPQDQKETRWMDNDYAQNLGYFNNLPEIESVINVKASWTVGSGYVADKETTFILDSFVGNGSDTFNTILENMERTKEIGGNSYSQIVRDKDGEPINLKPLDPEVMVHITDWQGMLIRFEQNSKVKGKKPKKFKPEDILYFARNRVADESHGNTMLKRLAFIILAKNEAMETQKLINKRFATPRWVIKLSSSNPTKIAAEKAKWDAANENGENMFVPLGSVEVEQMTIAPNSTLNLQANIDNLDAKFYEASQVPKIVVGGVGGITEAAVKIALLAFEQNIKERQLYVEEQIGRQLGMEIKLNIPVTIQNELISDQNKDSESGAVKPSDVTEDVK